MNYFKLDVKYNINLESNKVKTVKSQFLQYDVYQDPKKKTLDVCVRSADSDKYAILGEIKWHGAWRKYCLFTIEDTLFDEKCLGDVISFIKKLTEERKSK